MKLFYENCLLENEPYLSTLNLYISSVSVYQDFYFEMKSGLASFVDFEMF